MYIVKFDTDTGEVWAQRRDGDGKPVIDYDKGEVVLDKYSFKPPLSIQPFAQPSPYPTVVIMPEIP